MRQTVGCCVLLLLAGCGPKRCTPAVPRRVPTTQEDAHRFVERWNEYARALSEGHVALELWARVLKAWEKMTTE